MLYHGAIRRRLVNQGLTRSQEDYLECIGLLIHQAGEARLTDVALSMKVTKPSAHRAVDKLKQLGMVKHEAYETISLTEEGIALADNIIERHRALKQFLVERLKVKESTAMEDACRMEHAISQETMDKLILYLKKYEEKSD